MNEDMQPNPDDLLRVLKKEESRKKKGRLKIFLGMCAGVGKTYKMLEECQLLQKRGLNILVGVVNTHGRIDTAQMLHDLIIVPAAQIEYKGKHFDELNIDQILKLKPDIVVIDELAHSNIPGSRHPKRWQDVMEILEAGIDVYTTLNVQHIESLKDVVETITDTPIRETVPDSILEYAAYFELVDLPPTELIQRLKEGKVYLGSMAEVAIQNFFQEDRLTALRELALRFTAEKVDHDLHEMILPYERVGAWQPRERLMVAVSASPHSKRLVRTTRRLAFNLDAPWIAVFVDDGRVLDYEETQTLNENLALARRLGAEVVTISDSDVAQALQRVAQQKGVSQLIIGRPAVWSWRDLFKGSVLDRVARELKNIDLHVIRQVPIAYTSKRKWKGFRISKEGRSYVYTALAVLGLSAISFFSEPYLDYKLIGALFLLSILALSLFFKKGPVFFAAILFAGIWDFFFVPPVGEFAIAKNEDLALIILFLLGALVTGLLTDRFRSREEMLLKREEETQAIYEIVNDIATAPSSKQIYPAVKTRIGKILNGTCAIFVKSIEGHLIFKHADPIFHDEKEMAAARWVFENGREAGWQTHTLPMAKALYIPLKGYQEVVGVMAFKPNTSSALNTEQTNFLFTVAKQLADYIERTMGEERARRLELIHQVEKIHETILQNVSRQIYQPVKEIKETIDQLKTQQAIAESPTLETPLNKIEDTSVGLMQNVQNIATMAKFTAGEIPLNIEKINIALLIKSTCDSLREYLANHRLKLEIEDNLPLVPCDFSLLQILLNNLVSNAIQYSPAGTEIEVSAKNADISIIISVADEGPGIPPDLLETVFNKFYTGPDVAKVGIGLGLTVSRAIAEIHKGQLYVANRMPRGSIFYVQLPLG